MGVWVAKRPLEKIVELTCDFLLLELAVIFLRVGNTSTSLLWVMCQAHDGGNQGNIAKIEEVFQNFVFFPFVCDS